MDKFSMDINQAISFFDNHIVNDEYSEYYQAWQTIKSAVLATTEAQRLMTENSALVILYHLMSELQRLSANNTQNL
jgi:hypothetical protein